MYCNDKKVKKLIDEKKVIISPYFDDMQWPVSYYCHLWENLLIPQKTDEIYDPLSKNNKFFIKNKIIDHYILEPNKFVLCESFEFFWVDDEHMIRLFNSSSLARSWIMHLSLWMINPWCWYWSNWPIKLTLELYNCSPFPIKLIPTKILNWKIEYWTEILRIAVQNVWKVNNSYENWKNSIYNKDKWVSESKMNLRKNSWEFILPIDYIEYGKSK